MLELIFQGFMEWAYGLTLECWEYFSSSLLSIMSMDYLDVCELEVLEPQYSDNFVLKLLYEILSKKTSQRVRLPDGVFDMTTAVHGIYEE